MGKGKKVYQKKQRKGFSENFLFDVIKKNYINDIEEFKKFKDWFRLSGDNFMYKKSNYQKGLVPGGTNYSETYTDSHGYEFLGFGNSEKISKVKKKLQQKKI